MAKNPTIPALPKPSVKMPKVPLNVPGKQPKGQGLYPNPKMPKGGLL